MDPVNKLSVYSSAFPYGGAIPSKYTCEGDNINPPLEIRGVPEDAKSLAIIMDDPDIPNSAKEKFGIEVWDHWVLFNIKPQSIKIDEGKAPDGVPGIGTRKEKKYMGPCPPDREHRYFFKVYALNIMLDLPEGSTKTQVLKEIEGHVIASGELMGRYEKKNK